MAGQLSLQMDQKLRRFITTAVLIALVVIIIIFWQQQPELLIALTNISLANAILLILTRLGIFAMNGLFLREFAQKFNVNLIFQEWFGLAAITTMGNYLTPFSGGLLVRATYLKKRHQLPYAQFTTLLASNYLVMFWLIGLIGLLILWRLGQVWQRYWPIALLFSGVTAGISLIFILPDMRFTRNNRVSRFLNTLFEGWHRVKSDYGLLAKLIFLTLLTIILNGYSFWLAYWAIGQTISFLAALLLGLVAAFSIFINLTPGSIGVQEAMVALSSELLGAGSSLGLIVVLLLRSVTVLCAFVLGPLYSYSLSKKTHQP